MIDHPQKACSRPRDPSDDTPFSAWMRTPDVSTSRQLPSTPPGMVRPRASPTPPVPSDTALAAPTDDVVQSTPSCVNHPSSITECSALLPVATVHPNSNLPPISIPLHLNGPISSS